jgi:putative chitinase
MWGGEVIHADELAKIIPYGKNRVPEFIEPLNAAMAEFSINTPFREAAFVAQLAHESGEFRYVRELASGEAYEGRKDLGNTEAGDGVRYKGRGLIQITGRANYRALSDYFDVDFVRNPEWLETPEWACRSAAWFWTARGLNELADREDFKLITKRINGGYNGIQERLAYYTKALTVMES